MFIYMLMIKRDSTNLLKKSNLKVTPQRSAILEVIRNEGHIDIERLVEKVKGIIPSVSVATIYKNLNSLIESNIVSELPLPGRKKMYEITHNKHIHFVCKNCNSLEDIEVDSLEFVKIFQREFASNIDDFDVTLYGICKKCQNK